MTPAPGTQAQAGLSPPHHQPDEKRLRALLIAGTVDSTGLAFGWTVFLLVVTEREGVPAAAAQTSAMLLGIALSAPFGAWLTSRLSPRATLRRLAVAEGACRLLLFLLLAVHARPAVLAALVVTLNLLAWTAYAAMRSEAARATEQASGRSLTLYAAAIAGSEALAAAAAAMSLGARPSSLIIAVTGILHTAALTPQWVIAAGADEHPSPAIHSSAALSVLPLCGLGALVFVAAAGPTLLATVLAYRLHGTTGVAVSAISFTVGTLGATRLQTAIGRRRRAVPISLTVGALMVGGWTLASHHLTGLAMAQLCAGLAQCTLEGDLDTRIVTRLEAAGRTAGLGFASATRSLGGALAVVILPITLAHWSLLAVAAGSAALLLLAAAVTAAAAPMGAKAHAHAREPQTSSLP